jgi:hypothetical protein
MSTIKSFEDILAWQKARELSRIIGSYIDEGRFKKNFSLLDQIERSSGSIMDNIAEGFERSGNRGFCNFFTFPKVHVVSFVHNFIEHWIETISINLNSMNCIVWLKILFQCSKN